MSEETLNQALNLKPHEVGARPKISQQEMMDAIVRVSCMYLLFERETETGIRAALNALAQERHNQFHTKGGREGDGTSFHDCKNEVCQDVAGMINDYRKPSIEFNQLTAELMEEKYNLKILKGPSTCIVTLQDKSAIDQPPELPALPNQHLKMKV